MAGGNLQRSGGIIEGINVTPLVDITLVLLIIFIVTAKFVVSPAVPLDLPRSTQGEEIQTIFAVTVPRDGSLLLDGEAVTDALLRRKAAAALAKNPEVRTVIQADGDVPHRRVVAVMDILRESGLSRIAFGVVPSEAATAEATPDSGGTE